MTEFAEAPCLARLEGGPLDGLSVCVARASPLLELPALPSLVASDLAPASSVPLVRYGLAGRARELEDDSRVDVFRYAYLGRPLRAVDEED